MAKRNQPPAPGATTVAPKQPQQPEKPAVGPETPVADPEEPESSLEGGNNLDTETELDETFDPAWLAGLVWHGARRLPGTANRYDPIKRQAQLFDVLSWSRNGDTVTIVLSDGSKHAVEV